MIGVRYLFMAIAGGMLVRASRLRCALHGVGRTRRNRVLVNVITMHVVTVMQIIDMALMPNRRMPHCFSARCSSVCCNALFFRSANRLAI